MKIKLYFITVLWFCCACAETKKETIQKKGEARNDAKKDSTQYKLLERGFGFSTTGTYARQLNRTPHNMLTICKYYRNIKKPIISDTLLKFLIKHNIIPSTDYTNTGGADVHEIGKPENIEYERAMKKDSVRCCYYEIIDFSQDNRRSKVIGRLYEVGWRVGTLNDSSIFLSDTTEKYGSFALIMPAILKPPAYYPEHLKVPKLPYIKSLDPKASDLEGDYTKFAPAYRIIRDEEFPQKH